MYITYEHLWHAEHENVVRLAKFLKIKTCFCDRMMCRIQLIDLVSRRVQ